MIQWGILKGYILEGLLKDDPLSEERRFTDEQMLIWARWACAELSLHTAQQAMKPYQCDGNTYRFDLPTDIIEPILKAGLVSYRDGTGKVEFLTSYWPNPKSRWPHANTEPSRDNNRTRTFVEWPTSTLLLSFIPAPASELTLSYFKIWDAPTSDDSVLQFSTMFEEPFAYLVAALAVEPLGLQAANIRQWNRKVDSGTPEHNPLHRQQEHFLKQAHRLLSRLPAQDRENFYRIDVIDRQHE